MAQQLHLTIADQRPATERLCWLTLHAPGLARTVRAGQYLLVRCAESGSYDPLLRRSLFVAAAEESLDQIGLLYAPDERGLAWLARGRSGDSLDIIGPFGTPFSLDKRTRSLLLIGQGAGLSAVLLLARQAAARGCAVTLLAGAPEEATLPPPFLLPGDVEYQSIVGNALDLLAPTGAVPAGDETTSAATSKRDKKKRKQAATPDSVQRGIADSPLLTWADQICAAVPADQLAPLSHAIATARIRWERGFASALLEGPLVCGTGACGICAIEMRKGTRLLCSDGPVFELRDVSIGG